MRILRKPNRLKDYDYSSGGAYFITICTNNRDKNLSYIRSGDPCGLPYVELTALGKITEATLAEIETADLTVDKYVIIPNHIHLIIKICTPQDSHKGCRYGVTKAIGKYKSLCANRWLAYCKATGTEYHPIWQRSYYDHIIRSENDYLEIWKYIDENPIKWTLDKYYF